VIVSCPACQTHYRHRRERPHAKLARCSRCNEVFPLETAKQSYKVMQPADAAGTRRMTIGMDDPSLAAKLRETAMDASSDQSPPALTYRVMNDGETAQDDSTVDSLPVESSSATAPAAGDATAVPRLRPLLMALFPGSLGAAAGYYGFLQGYYAFADQIGAQIGLPSGPYPWMGFGGVVGLLAGWAWIRWTGRKR